MVSLLYTKRIFFSLINVVILEVVAVDNAGAVAQYQRRELSSMCFCLNTEQVYSNVSFHMLATLPNVDGKISN